MHAKTELFLHIVGSLFGGSIAGGWKSRLHPFGDWGFSDELERQIHRLRQRALLEVVEKNESADRAYRLTELARIAVHGDQAELRKRWRRPWDHTWRIVAFDLPEFKHAARELWRRELRRLKFGCLQGSVWVSPDPVDEIKSALEGAAVRTQRLLFIEGRPAAGESDAEIASAAWDFERINQLYAQHRKILESQPSPDAERAEIRARLPAWSKREYFAWKEIVLRDPLLPEAIWPRDYPGPGALEARESALKRARDQVRTLLEG